MGVWATGVNDKLIYGTTEGKETGDGTRSDSRGWGTRQAGLEATGRTKGAGGKLEVELRWREG